MEFESDQLLIFTVHNESTKCDKKYIYRTVRFLIRNSSYLCNKKCCKEGGFTKYNTTRRAIKLFQFVVKALQAGWFRLNGRIWPAGR